MSNDLPEPPVQRSTALALLHALPAIALISGYLWLGIGITAWALAAVIFGGSSLATLALLLLFVPAGIVLTIRQVRLAIDAERMSGS